VPRRNGKCARWSSLPASPAARLRKSSLCNQQRVEVEGWKIKAELCGGIWMQKDKSNENLLQPNWEIGVRPLLLPTPTRQKLKGHGCYCWLTIAMETASRGRRLVEQDAGSKAGCRSHQQGSRMKDPLSLRSVPVAFLKRFVSVRSGWGQDSERRVCSRPSGTRQEGEANRNLTLIIPNILALWVDPT